VDPIAFSIAGMGGVVGGSTGAAMAAIVMIFEMTRDYTVVIPLTLTVAVAYGTRRALVHDSIYTRKLHLRGSYVPEILRADVHFARKASEIMEPARGGPESEGATDGDVIVPPDATLWEVIEKMRAAHAPRALVVSSHGPHQGAAVLGTISQDDILDMLGRDMELF
jgi:CIC family chloride channel protein